MPGEKYLALHDGSHHRVPKPEASLLPTNVGAAWQLTIPRAAGEAFDAVSNELTFFTLPNCWELFGFDLMLDENWHVWLLEVGSFCRVLSGRHGCLSVLLLWLLRAHLGSPQACCWS